MNKIKNFQIFKQDTKGNDKFPTHGLSANIGTDKPEYVNIGGAWTKQGTKDKFLSVQLQNEFVAHDDPTKSRKGYTIVEDTYLAMLEEKAGLTKAKSLDDIPTSKEVDMSDMPF